MQNLGSYLTTIVEKLIFFNVLQVSFERPQTFILHCLLLKNLFKIMKKGIGFFSKGNNFLLKSHIAKWVQAR